MGLDFISTLVVAVKLTYQLACPTLSPTDFPGLHAELAFTPQRKVRVELPAAVKEVEIVLTQNEWQEFLEKGLEQGMKIPPGQKCALTKVEAEQSQSREEEQAIALEHAPYLVVRRDQINNRDTDLPLLLTYRFEPAADGGKSLLYTIYFSAEDSKKSLMGSEAMMGDAGRRMDIEWIYRVEWNRDGEIVKRQYQGGVFLGAGHSTKDFKGKYLTNTSSPILYNIASHNVFSDRAFDNDKLVGHSLLPVAAFSPPFSREEIVFTKYPWMIELSDSESLRENACLYTSDRYLYVQFSGKLSSGSLKAKVSLDNGYIQTSGSGYGSVKGFGEGEAYTAVPTQIQASELGVNAHGKVSLEGMGVNGDALDLKGIRFFLLEGDFQELTHRFHCEGPGIATECLF